jgi:hypothetical protein
METPTLTIKLKGADAIHALTGKGQLVGKGGAIAFKCGKLALVPGAHFESEVEGVYALAKGGGGAAKGAAVKGAAAKGGAAKAAAAKSAASGGAIWSGKSLALGWGLSALGPILVLGALGVGAVGIYLYRRNKKLEADEPAFDEDDVSLPTL